MIIRLSSTSVDVFEGIKGVCILGPMLYGALVLLMLF